MLRRLPLAILWALSALFTAASSAQERSVDDSASGGWEYSVAPLYIWFSGMSGDTTLGPVSAPINVEFKDALDNLEGIFTIRAEARRDNFAMFTDFMYMDLGPEAQTPGGGSVSVQLKNTVWEIGGAYAVRAAAPRVEVIAGGRYSELKLSTTPGPVSVRESWMDGFAGLRLMHDFGQENQWRASVRADAGAGGSDLSWSAAGLLSYRFKDWLRATGGYKWLSFDYTDGSGPSRVKFDVLYQGPIAGLELNF
jgi:hypothetical protein